MSKPRRPRFSIGERIGSFIVTQQIGHRDVNPRSHNIMCQAQHWYRVQCICRRFVLRSQQELRDTRRLQMCRNCKIESRKRT